MSSAITLGPFLMKGSSKSMGFWLFAPQVKSAAEITAKIIASEETIPLDFQLLTDSKYGIWIAESGEKLTPDTEYLYSIQIHGRELNEDFAPEDYIFRTFPETGSQGPMDFALISCNGIEEFEKEFPEDTKSAWNMWDRYLEVVRTNKRLYFTILGGDQVYMDDKFQAKGNFAEKDDAKFQRNIIDVYLYYWKHPSYRKIMARLPSILMWDDHDLIDGFGSRPEQFNPGGEDKVWTHYREKLTEAFYEFQASRNPGSFAKKGPFTFSIVVQNKGFLILDLRSERNWLTRKLLLHHHKVKVVDEINSLVAKNVDTIFFVSPVTMARMGGNIERAIGQIANYLWKSSQNLCLGHELNWKKPFFWYVLFLLSMFSVQTRINGVPGYYASGTLFLISLLNLFFDWRRNGNYLTKKMAFILRCINFGVIFLIPGFIFFIQRPTFSWRFEEFLYSIKVSADLLDKVIISSALAIGLLYLSNRFKKKYLKIPVLVTAICSLVFLFWAGMPGKNGNLYDVFKLLPQLVMMLFGMCFYLIAFLEASGALDMIAGLDDDVKDSWSSEVNSEELKWFKDRIAYVQKHKIKVVVLAGDIHTGGLSKLSFDQTFSDPQRAFPQIVSSPIGYVPMASLVEKLTSGSTVESLQKNPGGLYAYNLFYRCKRNFVVVRTSPISKDLEVSFFFEDILSPEIFRC